MADDVLAKELETLKADIAKLRVDVSDLTQAVKGVASEKAGDAKERLAYNLCSTGRNDEQDIL